MPPPACPQGALVVLNDARQFVATLPAEHAPFAAHEARRSSAGGPQPAGPAAAAPSAGAPERLRAEVAASCKHSASHLLARACDLCPAALEQLLL